MKEENIFDPLNENNQQKINNCNNSIVTKKTYFLKQLASQMLHTHHKEKKLHNHLHNFEHKKHNEITTKQTKILGG